MKPLLHLGSCSIGLAPAMLALLAGCSSSSASAGPGDGGTEMEASATPDIDGGGTPCTPNAHETVAAKVTLTVNWPTTLANAGCLKSKGCTGDINIWLLAHYDITGNAITGSTKTCGNQTPPIPLTALGTQSEGLMSNQTAVVQVNFAPDLWTTKITRETAATGTLGGWNIGSSMRMDPTTSVYGLKPSSPFASASTVWPASEMMIPATDLADDDNDMEPGITALPSAAMGNSLPATALATMPPFAPQADKLYLALRTQLSLYGKSTSCTDVTGTAEVQLLNNHVIGCHVMGASDCMMSQWDFIDSNSTVYVGPGVSIPAGTSPPSFAPPGIKGTFTAKIVSTDADGGGVDCAAVVAMFP